MTNEEAQLFQQTNSKLEALTASIKQLAERMLTTSDRKFLFQLVTNYVLPLISNAMTGNGAVVLGAATSGTIVEANDTRWSCTITNSGANDAFVNFWQGATLVTTGLLLRANGGAVTFGRGTDIPYNGRVTGFSTAGTTLTFVEFNIPIQELEF
jgi:hypothetical protein